MVYADKERMRQLTFSRLPPGQAKQASELLHDLPHLVVLGSVGDTGLLIRYELPFYTLERIEIALIDQGFHLDNSLLHKLRRALTYYVENLCCQNLAEPEQRERVRRIYARVYEHHPHGDHDDTPHELRDYR